MKSSDVTADILNYISDGKIHTLSEIASAVECSYSTAQRHVASLAYRYPIEAVFGRDKQGMKLDSKYLFKGKIISNDKLQIIGKALELLQSSNDKSVDQKLLTELIRDFALPNNKELENEDQQEQVN